MVEPLIRVRDIVKNYQSDEVLTSVLTGVSFEIATGEFVAIMGPSGSGKSTLMHILGFLDRPTSGVFYYKSEDTAQLSDNQLAVIRNQEVGFVFQSFYLLPKTSVLENVQLPLIYSGKDQNSLKARTAIKAVGLEHRLDYLPSQLSGGEKQRVAIARALVNDPEIIFADEPTGNLDSKSGAQVMNILQDFNECGKTIILVTHENETARHAGRIIQLKDGKIVQDYRVQDRITAKTSYLNK